MADTGEHEEEFVGQHQHQQLQMVEAEGEQGSRYPADGHLQNVDSMRDFWRISSDRVAAIEEIQEADEYEEQEGDAHWHQQVREHGAALRPYSFVEDMSTESDMHDDQQQQQQQEQGINPTGQQHAFYEYSFYHPSYDADMSSNNHMTSSDTNFGVTANYMPAAPHAAAESNHQGVVMRPVASVMNPAAAMMNMAGSYDNTFPGAYNNNIRIPNATVISNVNGEVQLMQSTSAAGMSLNRDMKELRRELLCPRSSDLLLALTKSATRIVQEHTTTTTTSSGSLSGASSDADDEIAEQEQLMNPDERSAAEQYSRAAIVEHPFYAEMVLAHVRIYKVGAPAALRAKLDDLTKKYQRYQDAGEISQIGDDPSLDHFMKGYIDLLSRFQEDMREPFNKFMAYKDTTTKELEDICGHYVETRPDEEDNYGFRFALGPMEASSPQECGEDLESLDIANIMYPLDVDESIVIDATASDAEIKKLLQKKYGRHIGNLKAEFLRVRKKGKLPSNARHILKNWFNHHAHWPYPSESEKTHLQKTCELNMKQINNWFINERKRHWSCEGKCMHPNTKFYSSDDYGDHSGHFFEP